MSKPKTLLLGAAGQLGTEIKDEFKRAGLEVEGLTRNEFNADSDSVLDKLQGLDDCDFLINCIAFHKTDQCEQNIGQSFRINAALPLALARFCELKGKTMVHISSDYVFNGRKREPYHEEDMPAPVNVYGVSKLAGEKFVEAYAKRYFILRTASLYGRAQKVSPGANFVRKMVSAARRDQSLSVINDQWMSPTSAAEVARAIRTIVESGCTKYGIYHCCNEGGCSWYELATEIFKLTDLKADLSEIGYKQFHAGAPRPQYCIMDSSKLSDIYKMPDWRISLKRYLTEDKPVRSLELGDG